MFLQPDYISPEEASEYNRFIRVFNKNDQIFKEGESSDGCFFLVRSGSVGVYRFVGGEECLIDRINAVSYVGEIEVLIPGPRIGSVRVLSETLTSYRFEKTDLPMIISKPKLADLLFKRLTGDLKDFSDRYVKDENLINRLLSEKEFTNQSLANLLSVIYLALEHLPEKKNIPEKSEVYLDGLKKMIQKSLAIKLPELNYLVENDTSQSFREMYKENLIPEELAGTLIQAIQNK